MKIIVLDNGAFHKAKSLEIPDNILLVFLPPYSPELNPAEKVWAKFKRNFSNCFMKNLNDLSEFIQKNCKQLQTEEVKSICRFDYIFLGNYWSI